MVPEAFDHDVEVGELPSEALQTKYDELFSMFDHDGDGAIERDDLLTSSRQILDALGYSADSPKAERIVAAYNATWAALMAHVDTDKDDVISRAEYTVAMERCANDPEFRDQVWRPCSDAEFAVLDVLDVNDNGVITPDEYATALTHWSVPEDQALAGAAAMDKNADGHITADEYFKALWAWMVNDDLDSDASQILGDLS